MAMIVQSESPGSSSTSPSDTMHRYIGNVLVDDFVPIVVRSDPFADLRPFIEFLWRTNEQMCRDVFFNDFPRGKVGRGATQQEEDEFLNRYFDAATFHIQGGRFLKQALYAIAKYNQDEATKFAREWAAEHEEYFTDPSVLMGMFGSSASPRTFFTREESTDREQSFLLCAISIIQQDFCASQAKPASPDGSPPKDLVKKSVHANSSVDEPVLDDTGKEHDVPHAKSSRSMTLTNKTSPNVLLNSLGSNSLLNSALPSAFTSRQPKNTAAMLQSGQPKRNASGAYDQTGGIVLRGGNAITNGQPSGRIMHPSPPVGFCNTTAVHSGSQTRLPDSSYMSDQISPQFLSGPIPPFTPSGVSPSPSIYAPTWPENNGNAVSYLMNTENRHRGDDQERIQMSTNNGLAFSDYPRREAHLSSTNMDPESFRRLSNDRLSYGGSYGSGSRQTPSMYTSHRHLSLHSNEELIFRGERYERRIFSDQPRCRQSSLSCFEPDSECHLAGRHGNRGSFSSRGKPSDYQGHVSSWSSDVPRSVSDTRENYIPLDRNDIKDLVVSRVPYNITIDDMWHAVSRHAKVARVAIPPAFDRFHQGNTDSKTMFVSFATANEARKVVARPDITCNGFQVQLKVPKKYLNHDQRTEFSPYVHHAKVGELESRSQPRWSAESAYHPKPANYTTVQSTGAYSTKPFHQVQGYARQLYRDQPVPGPSFQTFAPNLGGISLEQPVSNGWNGDRVVLRDTTPLYLASSSTPGSKKSAKKNKIKGAKSGAPLSETCNYQHEATVSLASNGTAVPPFDTANPKIRNTSTSGDKKLADVHTDTSKETDNLTKIHPPTRVNIASSYAAAIRAAADGEQPSIPPTGAIILVHETVTHLLGQHDDDAHAQLEQPIEALAGTQPAEKASNIKTCKELSDQSPSADADIGKCRGNTPSEDSTPPRVVDTTPKETPKANDDFDDSFQTAAETPESTRSTLVVTPDEKIEEETDFVDSTNSGSAMSLEKSDAPHFLANEDHAQLPDTECKERTSGTYENETANSAEATATHPASKRLELIRSGPSKTESLSPFARATHKKKERAKAQRKKGKSGRYDASETTDPHETLSMVAAQEEDIKSTSAKEPVITELVTTDVGHRNTRAMQDTNTAPARALLDRILPFMRSKNEKSEASVALHDDSIEHEIIADTPPIRYQTHLLETEDVLSFSVEDVQMHDSPGREAKSLDVNMTDSGLITGASVESQTSQMPARDDGQGTVKKSKKKKKKNSKRRGTAVNVHDGDASSTATLQTHTPEGSRPGSPLYRLVTLSGNEIVEVPGLGITMMSGHESTVDEDCHSSLMAPNPAVEYSLGALDAMIASQETIYSPVKAAEPDDKEKENEDVKKSRYKMRQLNHNERMKKLNVKGDLAGADAELAEWKRYQSEFSGE